MKKLTKIVYFIFLFTSVSSFSQEKIKVMSFNIKEGGVEGLDKVFNVIKDYDPDIVLIQEVNTGNDDFKNAANAAGYNYVINDIVKNSVFEPALLSKYPIVQEEIHFRTVDTKLDLGNGVYLMAHSVHLPCCELHPMRIYNARQIAKEFLRNEREQFPVIFGGDLNVQSSQNDVLGEFTSLGFKNDIHNWLDYIFSYGLKVISGTSKVIGQNIYGNNWPSDHNAIYIEYEKPVSPISNESNSFTINHNAWQEYTFSQTDFTSNIGLENFQKIKIFELPTRGQLVLNSSQVSVGDEINKSDFNNLVYKSSYLGRDEFKWIAINSNGNFARNTSYTYIQNNNMISDLNHRELYSNIEDLVVGRDLFFGNGDYFESTSEPSLIGKDFFKPPTYLTYINNPDWNNYLKVNFKESGIIYLAYDDRYIGKPNWLINNFTETDISFKSNNNNFTVFKKNVDSGEFYFGPNDWINWDFRNQIRPFILIFVPSSSLSTENYLKNNVTLYPNPVNDVIFINTINKETIQNIEIYNILGKKMMSIKNNNKINIENLKPGYYLIKIYSNKGVYKNKVIKE